MYINALVDCMWQNNRYYNIVECQKVNMHVCTNILNETRFLRFSCRMWRYLTKNRWISSNDWLRQLNIFLTRICTKKIVEIIWPILFVVESLGWTFDIDCSVSLIMRHGRDQPFSVPVSVKKQTWSQSRSRQEKLFGLGPVMVPIKKNSVPILRLAKLMPV